MDTFRVIKALISFLILGLVTFSVAFGLCIGQMGERGRPMLVFFTIMDECVMRLIRLIMWYVILLVYYMLHTKLG